MVYCTFPKCKSDRQNVKFDHLSFHKFPLDPIRRKLWADQVDRPNWKPSIHSLVCSLHFNSEDYEPKGEFGSRRRLKQSAVPQASRPLETPGAKSMRERKTKIFSEPLPKIKKVFTVPSWSPTTISLDKRLPGTALSAAPKPAQQARIVFNGNADDDDMEPEETETFPKESQADYEIDALKKTLFQNQLTIHKLKYEIKQVTKERDEFERLLTDSEAKNFEAEEFRNEIKNILSQDFKSADKMRQSIQFALDNNASKKQAKTVCLKFNS